jgi:hypothetical protein
LNIDFQKNAPLIKIEKLGKSSLYNVHRWKWTVEVDALAYSFIFEITPAHEDLTSIDGAGEEHGLRRWRLRHLHPSGTFHITLYGLYAHRAFVTKNTNYALRAGRPWAADRPAGGWPPAGHIVMIPKQLEIPY